MIRRKRLFPVALSFSWKARLRTKPLIWNVFFFNFYMQIKIIFTRKASHSASFWKWEFLELGTPLNFSLLTDWFSPPLTREHIRTLSTFSNVIKCYIICEMADSLEVGKKRTVTLSLTLLFFYTITKIIISSTSKNTLLSPPKNTKILHTL